MADIVPFGKYRGQPIEVMLADADYLNWVAAQPGLMRMLEDRHVAIFNLITMGAPQTDDTPEHNRLQVRFLDPQFHDGFLRAATGLNIAETTAAYADGDNRRAGALLRHTLAHYEQALVLADARYTNDRRSGGWLEQRARAEVERLAAGCNALRDHLHPSFSIEPPRIEATFEHGYDVCLSVAWNRAGYRATYSSGDDMVCVVPLQTVKNEAALKFRVEIKPRLGDDFPSVLRQMRRNQPRDAGGGVDRAVPRSIYGGHAGNPSITDVLLIDAFEATGATLEQVRAVFVPYKVITLAEVEGTC
jgi:hypothetical protein